MQRLIGRLTLIGMLVAIAGCGGSSFPLSLTISTSPATISGGGSYTFSASTTNSTSQSGVTWSLALNTPSSTTDTTTPCTASCGTWVNAGTTISSQTTSGSSTYYNLVTSITYTAPLTPPTPNALVLTATAASNSGITADVDFTIGAPAIVVRLANTFTTISPGAAPVTLDATVQFDSANAGVNWTLTAGGSACSPACGTLTPVMTGAASFNLPFPFQNQYIKRTMDSPGVIDLKCNAGHTWMNGVVIVVRQPYIAITDQHGAFRITDVPPGNYQIVAWHEGWKVVREAQTLDVGTQLMTKRYFFSEPTTTDKQVQVKPNAEATVNFQLSAR